MTNNAKPGEYTAYKKQAPDAAELTALLQEAVSAEEEMRAAVDVTNRPHHCAVSRELTSSFLCTSDRQGETVISDLIRIVHTGKSFPGWNDETYREVLSRHFSKRSARDYSITDQER